LAINQVTEAADGRVAWEAFQQSPAEVVVTDWMMPEMDGPTLCRRIREVKTCHYVYVMFLTVVDGKTRYLEAIDTGADDFLNKPLDREQPSARLGVAARILRLHKEIGELRSALRYCPGCKSYCDDKEQWRPIENLLELAFNIEVPPASAPIVKAGGLRSGGLALRKDPADYCAMRLLMLLK
jgi:DNA-binding response OmpR family regulator